ncbi:MAG: sigma-70 family RNA polymerase sigma factor [Gemmatimonadales bacterium]
MKEPADGRHAAFQAEALQHLDAVYRYAYALTRERSEAEDLTQDTFLQALRHWDQFRPGTNARAWLFTICRNLFLRQRERRSREEPMEAAALDGIAAAAQAAAAPSDAGRALFDAPELGDVIRRELDKLPAEYREVVELSDLQDQSYADIAQVLGVPLGTVKSRLFRGRRLLQEALVDYARDAGLLPPPGSDA